MYGSKSILETPIEYLKGVGPARADLLKKELGIFLFKDLLEHYPLRHIDKTIITPISQIGADTDYVQVSGQLINLSVVGHNRSKRLVGSLKDGSGELELVWFNSIAWIQKSLRPGNQYLVFGRAGFYQGLPQITHPEIESVLSESPTVKNHLEPVYPSTERLKLKGLGGRQMAKLTESLFHLLSENDIPEIIPRQIMGILKLARRFESLRQIHFPDNPEIYARSVYRLKFEELFVAQMRIGLIKSNRHRYSQGIVFDHVGILFNKFYGDKLPFELTKAQKRVLREIRGDTANGRQMNRLLQGDVGSGKTIVALLSMLLAADNGFQSCFMAPTEILARQHFDTIRSMLGDLPVSIRLLTGSSKGRERKQILDELAGGAATILVGTHAVIEEVVVFKNLGLAIIDEQHRFGVEQRSRLWKKSQLHPHILVMTATPIPRTLAMTAYGDLDYSVLDELPPGRQPVITAHRYDNNRSQVMDFIRAEVSKGRQAYLIFPLIEESEKVDYESLMQGYENVKAYFPEPKYWISLVHGRQKSEVRAINMKRFAEHDTQIMVATTVIEVGVDIPNATVMVIESAERFGLSQLHQLRGRVGRGAEKSFCILLSGSKLGKESMERLKIMTSTNDGFKIAEKDLELRGPGDISGTRQSGELNFKLASIVEDRELLMVAREMAESILKQDAELSLPEHILLKKHLSIEAGQTQWSKIS
ncbi:MAG TPA: ATP-dependent DNA helicase RecG [Puia sp.]|nr:ATP-dependent DNA helicase RecG [Puia sp.]